MKKKPFVHLRHEEQNRITLLDLLTRFLERLLHLRNGDARPELDVAQIQADALGVKVREGHLINGEGAGRGVKVLGRVDVRAGVVRHGDVVRRAAEGGRAGDHGLVRVPFRHDEGRVEGVAERAVLERPAEVDDRGFCRRRRGGRPVVCGFAGEQSSERRAGARDLSSYSHDFGVLLQLFPFVLQPDLYRLRAATF